MVWLKRDAVRRSPTQRQPAAQPSPLSSPIVAPEPAARPNPIADRLRALLEEGRFPTGSRLPAERALALQLGVGRPSIREAIKTLVGLGYLDSRRGSGTYILDRRAADPQVPALALEQGTADFGMLDLLEVRMIVEPRAAWLAATRAKEQDLREIENARQRLELHDRDWKLAGRLDIELHSAIIRGARNPVLSWIHQFIVSRLAASQTSRLHVFPDIDRMRKDHRAVVEAILKRQADAAEKAMIDHLNSAGLDFISEAAR